jgi:hypothetical protein
MNGPLLPPPPAAVASYFTRRRSAIAEFTPEDLASNERLWAEACGEVESPDATMPTEASARLAGEQIGVPRTWDTPAPPLQISECAEAIAAAGKTPISPPRAYHRRSQPRGTGRWAQKRRRAGELPCCLQWGAARPAYYQLG